MIRPILTLTGLALASNLALAAEPITEAKFVEMMKETNTANRRFKDAIAAENGAQVAKDARRVAELFTQMAAFWKQHKLEKPEVWSKESAEAAKALAAAADAGNWAKARESAPGIGKNCKNCHDAHREKDGDNYKIKY